MAQAKSFPAVPKSSIPVFLNTALPCAATNRCEFLFLVNLLATFSRLLSVPSSLFPVHCDRISRATEAGVEVVVSTLADDPAIITPTRPACSVLADDHLSECPSPKMATRHRQARCTRGQPWLFPMLASPLFVCLPLHALPLTCRPPVLDCRQDLCRLCNSHTSAIVKVARPPSPCINLALKRLSPWLISRARPASHSIHLSPSRSNHSTIRFPFLSPSLGLVKSR